MIEQILLSAAAFVVLALIIFPVVWYLIGGLDKNIKEAITGVDECTNKPSKQSSTQSNKEYKL